VSGSDIEREEATY